MYISCDLDGVIINLRHLQKTLLEKRGLEVPDAQLQNSFLKTLLSPVEYSEFSKELYEEFSISAPEILGARDSLERLARDDHVIRIISRRSGGKPQAVTWLKQHGFFKIIPKTRVHFVVTPEEKENVCRTHEIALHVDDSLEVLEKLKTPRHKVLFNPQGGAYSGITATVRNWQELLEYISDHAV